MPNRLATINLFPREGESIIETEHGPISVTATQFLAGWRARRPPFGNGEAWFREPLPAKHYDVAAWANDDVRASWSDASGKWHSVTVERNGKTHSYAAAPTPPANAKRDRRLSLNLTISEQREKAQPQQQPQPQAQPQAQSAGTPGAFFDE